jgi:asparagine synthetase B (glutamine-hydrolysing)
MPPHTPRDVEAGRVAKRGRVPDFLFSSRGDDAHELAGLLEPIRRNRGEILTWRGDWGSLACIANHYHGFAHVEDHGRITVVLGGPLFNDPVHERARLSGPDGGTRVIHDILRTRAPHGATDWYGLLNLPFAIVSVDTASGALTLVTDPWLHVPVFRAHTTSGAQAAVFGSHVECVARLAGRRDDVDPVSLVDYLVHMQIVWPHTIYDGVMQLPPGSEWTRTGSDCSERQYWVPREKPWTLSLQDTAVRLRERLSRTVAAACAGCRDAGVLLSGGMDSRVVLGSIPPGVETVGYTFTESINREAGLARRVARAWGSRHVLYRRSPNHYLDLLPESAAFMGPQDFFIHTHAFAIADELNLLGHDVVLGGSHSDAYLKSSHVIKEPVFRGGPQRLSKEQRLFSSHDESFFKSDLLDEMHQRRKRHFDTMKELIPSSPIEWMTIYPSTTFHAATGFTCNRRMFRNCEPYLDFGLTEMSVSIPIEWKINKHLFQQSFLPLLRKTLTIRHTDGTFPHLGFWGNRPFHYLFRLQVRIGDAMRTLLRHPPVNREAWPVMERLTRTPAMQDLVDRFVEPGWDRWAEPVMDMPMDEFLERSHPLQRLALLQFMCTRARS